jgi:hypothetical protein
MPEGEGRFLLLGLVSGDSQKESSPERLRSGAVYKANMTSGQYRASRRCEKNTSKNK